MSAPLYVDESTTSLMNAEAAAAALGQGASQRRSSLILGQIPRLRPQISRNSIVTNPDDLSMFSDASFANYGSTANGSYFEQQYIQSRRASLASRQDHSHHNTHHSAAPEIPLLNGNGALGEVETSILIELRLLFKSSMPLMVTFLLQFSLTVASVFSVGQLGSQQLAAVSLSNLLANISGYGIIQGIASSLSTLCPQAFGRKDYKSVGLHALRCTYVLIIVYFFIYLFWTYGSFPLLNSVIEDDELCVLASDYLRVLIYGVPGFILFEILKQYLQAQGIFHASTYVLLFCAPLNIVMNYELVWNKSFGIGFIGAPTSIVITNWLMALLLLLYTLTFCSTDCWCGFTPDAFKNWNRLIKLATPGVITVESEWLAFEIITFSASRFGTVALAAQSVVSTTCVLLYQIPFAISIATSTRVAWFIGSASKSAALTATKSGLIIALIFGFLNCAVLTTFRASVPSLFSNDEDVILLAAKVLVLGAIYQVNDVLACVTGGILRGQGRQYIAGWLSLFSYYCVALPCSFLFAFHFGLELFGLWIGLVIALFFVSAFQLYVIYMSDWNSIILQSIKDAIEENAAYIKSSDEHHQENNGGFTEEDESELGLTRVISNAVVDHSFLSPTISVATTEILMN